MDSRTKAERQDLHALYEKDHRPAHGQREEEASMCLAGVGGLLLLALVLVPLKLVTVKMLPFDNKSELQVIIDMPEGSDPGGDGRADPGDGRVSEDACRR